MNSDTLYSQLVDLGLGVSREGSVYDCQGEYAVLGDKQLICAKGKIKYRDIGEISYVPMDGTLTMFIKNGGEVVCRVCNGLDLDESSYPTIPWFPCTPKSFKELVTDIGLQEVQYTPPAPRSREGTVVRDLYGKDELPPLQAPTTISSLVDMMPAMFGTDLEKCFWYDELTEKQMVDTAAFGKDMGIRPMSDELMCIYHDCVERKLAAMGASGRLPSTSVRDEALNVMFADNHRNQFREWLEDLHWDGVPRICTMFRDLFGGTAPALRTMSGKTTVDEEKYLADVAEAWILGAVARAYEETKHEVVPVFIGTQGIGKGTVLKYLAGKDEWYRDTTVDFKDPGRFLDSIRGAIIVELGEGVQLDTDDLGTLKAFISKSSDHMRKAYARHDQVYPRHFIMAASSNTDTLFNDPTGARRFYPIYCDPAVQRAHGKVIPSHGRPQKLQEEVEQIWAEARYLYMEGHKWYIADAEANERSVRMQSFCSTERESDIIAEYLDDPLNGFADTGAIVSKAIVLTKVFGLDPPFMRIPEDVNRAWKQWTSFCPGWERVPNPVKLNGKTTRVYKRIHMPDDIPKRKTFNMVDGGSYEDAVENADKDVPDSDTHRDDDPSGGADPPVEPEEPRDEPEETSDGGIPPLDEGTFIHMVNDLGAATAASEPEDITNVVTEEDREVEKAYNEAVRIPKDVPLIELCYDPMYSLRGKSSAELEAAMEEDRETARSNIERGKDPKVCSAERVSMWRDAERLAKAAGADPDVMYDTSEYVAMDDPVPKGVYEPPTPPTPPADLIRAWAEGRGYTDGTVIPRSSVSERDADLLLKEGFAVMSAPGSLRLVNLMRG